MHRYAIHYSLVFVFCSLLILPSCRTKKIATGATPHGRMDSTTLNNEAYQLIRKSRENALTYDWLSARIRVEYSDDNISQDFTAVVRMRRDSVMWISLQGPFGIEGARIMVTRDTIRIINKLSGEYLVQPLSYLSKVLPIEAGLPELQDFILGNYLLLHGAVPDYRGLEDSMHLILAESPLFRYQTSFNLQNCTLAKSVLTDKMISQEMRLTFDGYSPEQGRAFSHERDVAIIKGIRNIKIHLAYSKIRVNEVLNFPFEIGPGMKAVDNIRF